MEKQKFTPAKTALNFGLLLGGISVIFGIMLYVLDMHYQNDTSTSLISYAFLIGIIVWGIIHYQDLIFSTSKVLLQQSGQAFTQDIVSKNTLIRSM